MSDLDEFRRQVDGDRSIAVALAKRFTQDELGLALDLLMASERGDSAGVVRVWQSALGGHVGRALIHAVGSAWADYEYGGDEAAATAAAVKRGDIA